MSSNLSAIALGVTFSFSDFFFGEHFLPIIQKEPEPSSTSSSSIHPNDSASEKKRQGKQRRVSFSDDLQSRRAAEKRSVKTSSPAVFVKNSIENVNRKLETILSESPNRTSSSSGRCESICAGMQREAAKKFSFDDPDLLDLGSDWDLCRNDLGETDLIQDTNHRVEDNRSNGLTPSQAGHKQTTRSVSVDSGFTDRSQISDYNQSDHESSTKQRRTSSNPEQAQHESKQLKSPSKDFDPPSSKNSPSPSFKDTPSKTLRKASSSSCLYKEDQAPGFGSRKQAPRKGSAGSAMVAGSPLPEDPRRLSVRAVKIILLGDYSVGKSSLFRMLARHSQQLSESVVGLHSTTCSTTTSYTVNSSWGRGGRKGSAASWVSATAPPGGFFEMEFSHHDKAVLVRISDTGGQERYRSMTTSYYRDAHGCLLMFDVTKEESFLNLDAWLDNIDSYKTTDSLPCILVGTRANSSARRVPFQRAADFADSRGLPYMELDMDHMTDVRRVFEKLLDNVTINMANKRSPIAVSIRPELSNSVRLEKRVVCAC